MRPHLLLALALTTAPSLSSANLLEEVVVTATRSEQTLKDVASNTAFVREDDLALISHTHISESLARVAGAWISRGNGQEHLTAIRSPVFTGAGACGAFLMMEDSIGLRASGFCNANELFDANSEQARRIEVIKGPASVLYGSNAMHGMVNILTPLPTPVRSLGFETGPHDYYRLKASLGTDGYRLDVNGASDGGYKDDAGFDQQKLTAKALGEWRDFNITTALTATNLNQETAGFIQGPLAYKDPALKKFNPNPEAFRDTWSARLYSRWQRSLDGDSQIVLTPYLRKTAMTFIQHFLPGQAIEDNSHESIGLQSAYYFQDWILGMDLEFTEGVLKETQPLATVGSAFLVATIPQGDHYDYTVKARTIAAFAEHRFDIGSQSEGSIGLRVENVRYDYDNRMIAGRTRADGTPCGFGGCRFNRPADRVDTFTNVSPRLGLKRSLSRSVQAYAFLSRGFRAPQTSELYRLQDGQEVTEIDSEQLDSFELGVRGNAGAIGFDVAAYTMKKDNYIFRDNNRRIVDNGETSHHGVELDVSWAINESLSTKLNWSYALHRYENNPALVTAPLQGNEIDTAPRHLGSASINWQPADALVGELELVHVGRYFEDDENLQPYEGHDLVNLRIRWQFHEMATSFVRITNLLDTDYAERADFAFGVDRYFVGEPRSIYLGFDLRL